MNITLPLGILRSLIYGESSDASVPLCQPTSGGIGDLAKIKVTHYEVGQLIQTVDADEIYFHVELFEGDGEQKTNRRAELWMSFEWNESNARNCRRREKAEIERKIRSAEEELAADIADELDTLPPELAITDDSLRKQLARNLAMNYKKYNLTELLRNLNLLELIERHEKLRYEKNTEDNRAV